MTSPSGRQQSPTRAALPGYSSTDGRRHTPGSFLPRQFYDRLGGEWLREQKQNDFGGDTVVSVAYGWRDLAALTARLEAT